MARVRRRGGGSGGDDAGLDSHGTTFRIFFYSFQSPSELLDVLLESNGTDAGMVADQLVDEERPRSQSIFTFFLLLRQTGVERALRLRTQRHLQHAGILIPLLSRRRWRGALSRVFQALVVRALLVTVEHAVGPREVERLGQIQQPLVVGLLPRRRLIRVRVGGEEQLEVAEVLLLIRDEALPEAAGLLIQELDVVLPPRSAQCEVRTERLAAVRVEGFAVESDLRLDAFERLVAQPLLGSGVEEAEGVLAEGHFDARLLLGAPFQGRRLRHAQQVRLQVL